MRSMIQPAPRTYRRHRKIYGKRLVEHAMFYQSVIRPIICCVAGCLALSVCLAQGQSVTISVATENPLNRFIPSQTFGAGIDGHEYGDTKKIFTKKNIAAMKSVGFGPLSYRLRTELGIETWHWNNEGQWSDPVHQRGYWVSSYESSKPIEQSYGYRLPRRGNTIDQANNDGYSRLDDGDQHTFWKSNPYLDRYFTGEDNARHPQWVVVDFAKPIPINALRIHWGGLYATEYTVEYCTTAKPDDIEDEVPTEWHVFPWGAFSNEKGATQLKQLSPTPISTRFVRIMLKKSSSAIPKKISDIRDYLGYAIREIELGRINADGKFEDKVRHAKNNVKQTPMYVSSTDPWHSIHDRDINTEQPGFDKVYQSGLTNNQPMLLSAGVLYDTPENVAAAIRYLQSRGYPFTRIEMGEEPDGQYVTPEDYGALYIQMADAIHAVDPELKLGGPCFQTNISEYRVWPIGNEKRTWMARFLSYLKERNHEKDYSFFSFEWYPFDKGCISTAPQLAAHPGILRGFVERLQRDGLSPSIPWMMTEYGYSAFSCRAEVDIEGALFNADAVALFLSLGGDQVYLYGYEPGNLMDELSCNSWGNNMIFLADDNLKIKHTTATYFGAKMINENWVKPGNQPHEIYAATSSLLNKNGQPLVSAYALRRPDQLWSILMINKDPVNSHPIRLEFQDKTAGKTTFAEGDIEFFQYSRDQYQWKPDGEHGRPIRNDPPMHKKIPSDQLELPPYSLSVVLVHLPH